MKCSELVLDIENDIIEKKLKLYNIQFSVKKRHDKYKHNEYLLSLLEKRGFQKPEISYEILATISEINVELESQLQEILNLKQQITSLTLSVNNLLISNRSKDLTG